jgi:hypothetical protein
LRSPLNEIDSRFLRVLGPLTVELDADACRGTREDVATVEGDARTDCLWATAETAALGVCPFSSTPNSEASFANGDAPRDAPPFWLTKMLARRDAPLPLSVGEFVADVRLDIRGIFVGVSFVSATALLSDDAGGGSRADWCGRVPTLGEPAIVGRTWRESLIWACSALTIATSLNRSSCLPDVAQWPAAEQIRAWGA